MSKLIKLAIISMLTLIAFPAYSATTVQVYSCEMDEDATEAQVIAGAGKWLKAAKTMKGGENLTLHLEFPVAVDMEDDDFVFVVTAPSFSEWGTFIDGYNNSPASKVDLELIDIADCPNSSLWESIEIH